MKNRHLLLGLVAILFVVQALGEEALNKPEAKPDVSVLDNLDFKAWGIDNGCITTSRIRSFRYFEPGAARVELGSGKVVIMRFSNNCSGLRGNGIIYETRTGKLCERFDSVRVLNQGSICPIESIEPLVEPETTPNDEKESLNEE